MTAYLLQTDGHVWSEAAIVTSKNRSPQFHVEDAKPGQTAMFVFGHSSVEGLEMS